MRLRNQSWVKLIKKYRQKHPNALFIVHCGEFHSDYLEPFAVPLSFPEEQTFVSAVYTPAAVNQFEQLLPNPFTKIPTLKWGARRFGRVTGYDLRVFVPQ